MALLVMAGCSLLASPGLRAQNPLPGTAALTASEDLSAQMIAGIGHFLEKETAHAEENRAPAKNLP
ncbi:MAG: hypothetical protein HY736_07985 [Verrucomicrobia bacterium]|nr:hypothetical protein [Verrucomicrobiota bacterium]